MPRQPTSGAGAAVRALSGAAAARPPAPSPSSPLSPQRYRALRARYNALIVTLYERTSLTQLEIAALAGHTKRAVQMLVRALGCPPRNARKCRPGSSLGPRRAGPVLAPLNAPATRRVAAAFADVARELAASPQARAAAELQRATAWAERRAARTQHRIMTGAARELAHLASAMEHTAAAADALAGPSKRARAAQVCRAPKQPSPAQMRLAQERVLREQEARMHQAQEAARLAKAAPAATPPAFDADADRRINAVAERYYTRPPMLPRIRRPW